MTYLSILEKLQILFKTLLDFKFILVFTILLLMLTLLYVLKKFNGKKYILCMTLSFIGVFAISIISNYEVLSDTFDNFTTILFGNIYFPSIYAYIGILVIGFISFVTSLLKVMLKKVYKVINSVMFVTNNILLVIILNIIAKNKIDIFSINSLYSDTTLVVLLELSMGLFVLWILSLIVVYVTNCICERIAYKKTYNVVTSLESDFNPVLEVSGYVEDFGSDNKHGDNILVDTIENDNAMQSGIVIENNYEPADDINYVDNQINDTDLVSGVTFNDILNGCMPITYYDNNVAQEKFKLANPQAIYENKYKNVKDSTGISDAISNNNYNKIDLSMEDNILKEKLDKERTISDTVSLNDLIDDKIDMASAAIVTNISTNDINTTKSNKKAGYTVEDYRRMANMLRTIKLHSNSANIKIDDAVAIGLISNYSIDDCMKFKNILESNLN